MNQDDKKPLQNEPVKDKPQAPQNVNDTKDDVLPAEEDKKEEDRSDWVVIESGLGIDE